jgi:GTP-binding protein
MALHSDIRNLAIIAHVDHGKTTLVDTLLTAAGAFDRTEGKIERGMDSMDLERERGITITSKPTSLSYKGVRINLVDTPGHADFGGEVERVLNMVDAVLLVVDAFEGPMPQTRFVTEKAIARGLKILLVVNKIDRPGSEPHKTVDAVFDLLHNLGATDEQMDFPVIFCSARERYAMKDPADERGDMTSDPRLHRRPRAPARGHRRPAGDVGLDPRLRPLPRLHRDRPHPAAACSASASASP